MTDHISDDIWDSEIMDFVNTPDKYVCYSRRDNTYYFVDEAFQLQGNGPYNTLEEAQHGLAEYFKNLNRPKD